MFAGWGRLVWQHRWATLLASGMLLIVSAVGLLQRGSISGTSLLTSDQESARAASLIADDLSNRTTNASTFDLIFHSSAELVSDPGFQAALDSALDPIRKDPRVLTVVDPFHAPSAQAAQALISTDKHSALASIGLRSSGSQAWSDYDALRAQVTSRTLDITATGFVPVNEAFNQTLESDLRRAETVTIPICLLLLVLIFGSIVSAAIPLGVGLLTIAGGIAGALFLNRFTDVSQYALNVVTLIGLGVSIDYSLFIVSRFREELALQHSPQDSLVATMASAGRTIAYSGITVAIGLSTLFFFAGTFLASLGAVGALVVMFAVFYALTFLPALLAVIGSDIERLKLPPLRRGRPAAVWPRVANAVMARPLLFAVVAATVLVGVGAPVLSLRLANGSPDILPARSEARQGYDALMREFPGQSDSTIQVVLFYPNGAPLAASRIGDQFDFDRRIAHIHGVDGITSIYDLSPTLQRSDYERLYSGAGPLPPEVTSALRASVGQHIVVLDVTTRMAAVSDGAQAIVKAIRGDRGLQDGGVVLVGGQAATNLDVVGFVSSRVPRIAGFVVVVTFLVLIWFTRSLVVPAKAVITNVLSIGASFGALVWIFQLGHLSNLLGFTPQPIDPGVPAILFAVVFGLSMDYEVLLVSRIREEYLRSGNNRDSVATGLAQTGRLISGAAAIMATVFLAFGLAEVVIIKELGIGLAIAVAIDATVVRGVLVPAAMRMLGDLNWWAPRFLRLA